MAKSIMSSTPRTMWDWIRVLFPRYVSAPVDPIQAAMVQRMREVQRGEYDPIGIVSVICLPADRVIILPKDSRRPALARFHSDSEVDFIDAWEYDGLPEYYIPTDVLCPDCKAPCRECVETFLEIKPTEQPPETRIEGWFDPCAPLPEWQKQVQQLYGPLAPPESSTPAKLATAERGGGSPVLLRNAVTVVLHPRKILVAGEMKEFFPGKRPCIYGRQTDCCGGTGVIAAQENKLCPTCGGTGAVDCRKCGGSGLMSTGRTSDGKYCESCGGTSWVRQKVEQKLADFLDKAEGGIGPIVSLRVHPPTGKPQTWLGKVDDTGHYPYLVSQNMFSRGGRVVRLGGVLRSA